MNYTTSSNTTLAPAKYNGNIAEVLWKSVKDGIQRNYLYDYDALNRLKSANFRTPSAANPETDFYNESLTYDVNGNITALQRYGRPLSGTTALKIDQLTYTYTGNQLTKVADATGNASGYPYLATPNTITYDANGNMTKHLDKSIIDISYNFLNLPNKIAQINGTTDYVYRADGLKVRKINQGVSATGITDYLDGFQYNKSVSENEFKIQFVPTAEGYYDFANNRYAYNYTDHLGNVRLSYADSNKNGVIDPSTEIIEENNYYPFGLKHEGYNSLVGNPKYQYKYNGKELQETGMYDYGARFYMPDIGRWGVVDPLAEKYMPMSPYNYAGNNPVIFIDPNGKEIINGETEKRKQLEEQTKQKQNAFNNKYGGDMDKNKKDFASGKEYREYKSARSDLQSSQKDLNKSIETENLVQKVIDNFKFVDPENFNLANNLSYKDADGNSHNIDVKVISGDASLYGGAFTGIQFTSTKDGNGDSQYYGIHSITTTLDLKKVLSLPGAFAHEMGHAYNTVSNPAQARLQGVGDTGTINCQDPANRNTFQSKTAMDWQQRYIINQTILMLSTFGR